MERIEAMQKADLRTIKVRAEEKEKIEKILEVIGESATEEKSKEISRKLENDRDVVNKNVLENTLSKQSNHLGNEIQKNNQLENKERKNSKGIFLS